MKLQTTLNIPSDFQLDYSSKIISLGSCFSENIGGLLAYHKFDILVNPFGILFHSNAIKTVIERIVEQKYYTEEDTICHNNRWVSLEVHSSFGENSQEMFLETINNTIKESAIAFKKATHLFITLGTAWVYTHKETDKIVANCHKIPQKNFEKRLLSVEEITQDISQMITMLKSINPSIIPIFSVSPVRHLKDGFVENQRSKAHLLTAIHKSLEMNDGHYVPAYEIIMDELRDYRFYAEDMLHPNQIAIQYIWEKFIHSYMSEKTRVLLNKVNAVQKALEHRPLFPNTVQYQEFKEATAQKIEELKKEGILF
ncbi:MAG: GSCFA domain-containing protein [Flavobacteriaceae bacterium]|nr:GSCFA domain-containing protein [Flavobacteriaceae bacterium]